MRIERLELEEFRSYHHLDLEFDHAGIRIVGPNASGKSSILEAIALLATTRSPRSSSERELINWSSGADLGVEPFARIKGDIEADDRHQVIEIAIEANQATPNRTKKSIKVGGRPVRAMDAVGRLKAVSFAPEDVALIGGPPSLRRRAIDLLLSQIDRSYMRALSRYAKVLEQRNGLLKSFARDRLDPRSAAVQSQLAYWDDEFSDNASLIIERRERYTTRLREQFIEVSAKLSDDLHEIRYQGTIDSRRQGSESQSRQESAERLAGIRQRLIDTLDHSRKEEVLRGMTITGPHRDDLLFFINDQSLAAFGSRGQQRIAVIALKLAESLLIEESSGTQPIVLLDDALSELDRDHVEHLLTTVRAIGSQIVLTSADEHSLHDPQVTSLPLVIVENGAVVEIRG